MDLSPFLVLAELSTSLERRNAGSVTDLLERASRRALAPLREFLREYSVIPTYTLAPKKLVIDTLDFDPDHIKAALKQGRDQAREEWPAIQQALGLATN